MATVAWNPILVPSSERWNVNKGASRSGGRSITNQEQVVVGPSGYVTASLTIPVNKPAKVLAMRAMLAALDGRAGTVLIGPREGSRVPWFVDPWTGAPITAGAGRKAAAIDPAWAENADTSADLVFRLGDAAPMNATALTIRRIRGGFLAPGMMFSILGHLHIITALTTADPIGPNGMADEGNIGVVVRPWARVAYGQSSPVEFARPVCEMRRASDDDGELELQLSRFGTVTLDFVEAF